MSASGNISFVSGTGQGRFTEKVLVSKELKRKLLLGVLIGHVLLIVVPVLVYIIADWFKPERPKTLTVRLVTPPPENNYSAPTPAPPLPVPPRPEPPKPEPPKPEPPKPPKKAPEQPPKKKSVIKKKTPPKKKWKAVSAKDIKVSKKVIKNQPSKPVPTFNANKLADKLKKTQPKVQFNSGVAADRAELAYYQSVRAYVQPKWDQPSRLQLGGGNPTVDVLIKVAADGRIISARIVRGSGVRIMDASVDRVFKSLRALPKPPKAMQFTMTFETE